MKITRSANAQWQGTIKEGGGNISTQSGALKEQPYGFNTRFEDKVGTNPEELIGAAHASCYSMALSLNLTEAGFTPTQLDTKAEVILEKDDGGFSITTVHLTVNAKVPDLDAETFSQLAEKTKDECPVSKVLNADISLKAELYQ